MSPFILSSSLRLWVNTHSLKPTLSDILSPVLYKPED